MRQCADRIGERGSVCTAFFGALAVIPQPVLESGALVVAEQQAAGLPAAFHGASKVVLVLGEGVQIRLLCTAGCQELAFQEPHVLHQAVDGLLRVVDAVTELFVDFLDPRFAASDVTADTAQLVLQVLGVAELARQAPVFTLQVIDPAVQIPDAAVDVLHHFAPCWLVPSEATPITTQPARTAMIHQAETTPRATSATSRHSTCSPIAIPRCSL